MPESSEPKLDWSKFGVELVIMTPTQTLPTPLPTPRASLDALTRSTGLDDADADDAGE